MYSVNGVLESNKTIAAGYNYMYKRRLNKFFTVVSEVTFVVGYPVKSNIWKTNWKKYKIINPISAGVLENQDMLGGGQFDPPSSKSNVWCPNMTNDTSLESSCALLLETAKKLQICKIEFFIYSNIVNRINVCKIKICPKKEKILYFWKALAISNMQKI